MQNDPQITQETTEIVPRDPRDPKATVNHGGRYYTPEEYEVVKRQEAARRVVYHKEMKELWSQTEQGRICLELYAKFQEYKQYLEDHPHARRRRDGAQVDFEEHMVFQQALSLAGEHERERAEKLRRNLERAQRAARCQHVHTGGDPCGCPRVRGKKLCYMHLRIEEAKAMKMDLGALEDADSIQLAIMKLQRAIIDSTLDTKQISQLSYLIQLAAWNVTRTTTAMVIKEEEVEEEEEEEYE
jgi:hypothetical protein